MEQTKLKYSCRKNQDLFGSFLNESSVKLGYQDYFGAIEAVTKAININNKYPIPFIRRAEIRYKIKDYKNANDDLNTLEVTIEFFVRNQTDRESTTISLERIR